MFLWRFHKVCLKIVYVYTVVFICTHVSKFIFHSIQILSLYDVQCFPSALLGVMNEIITILPAVFYGCETRSLTLMGETYVDAFIAAPCFSMIQLFSYTNLCTCIYIIKSLKHFVHLIAPTCFDT
jgi:hypothetical protein